MSNATLNNGQGQRKQLSAQLDRLDTILDGLDEALQGAVADAVTGVVGQVVREAVESTIREVLGNPDLLRAALARHAPVAQVQLPPLPPVPPRRPLQGLLSALCDKAREKAVLARAGLKRAWSWSLGKLRQGLVACRGAARTAGKVLHGAWRWRATLALALAVGVALGVGSYLAGPEVSSAACGVCGAALATTGRALWPLGRLLAGSRA